jgi:hypothetical protein
MVAPASRPISVTPARAWVVLLLAVVVGLGLVQMAQPLHLHHGATAGLYNEEHVLAAAESTVGEAPLPDPPPGVGIGVAPASAPRPSDAPPAPPVDRHTESRAPPLG